MKKVGVVGLGSFGRFFADQLKAHFSVLEYDPYISNSAVDGRVSIGELGSCDAIFLCVPLAAYETLLPKLASHISSRTVLIDLCSVKVAPEALIQHHLPGHTNILLTHPMFGPESASRGTAGNTLFVTKCLGEMANTWLSHISDDLGLKVHHLDADVHDRLMAKVQALTFFVGRGLQGLDLDAVHFSSPSFDALRSLSHLEDKHSQQLFETIQVGNPFATDERKQLLDNLNELHNSLEDPAHS